MASRAQLLAGLRTGGPRAMSPDDDAENYHASQNAEAAREAKRAMLKANAAPFTPSMPGRTSEHPAPHDIAHDLEARFAALQMQQAMMSNGTAQAHPTYGRLAGHQQNPRRPSNQQHNSIAQEHLLQQQRQAQVQAQQVDQLIRQKQAQLLQNQLLQHYQEQQAQLETLRHAATDDAQAQYLASQQQMLLMQMQGNLEQLTWQQAQQRPQGHHHRSASASEQRHAAHSSLQASLRQRQASQHSSQQISVPQLNGEHQGELSHQHQLLLQRINGLRQTSQPAAASESNAIPMRAGHHRAGSPGTNAGQARRERLPSSTAADMAKSWRSSSTTASKYDGTSGQRSSPPPPSIVVDDSASEKSDEQSSNDVTALETPETSSEDVGFMLRPLQANKDDATITISTVAPLPTRKRIPSTQQHGQMASMNASSAPAVRGVSLGASPRPRTLASGEISRVASTGSSSAGSVTPSIGGSSAPQPARQPRGPPSEFHAVNFATRLSQRTRREAMVKLSASPRVASFTQPTIAVLNGNRRPSISNVPQ